MLPSEHRLRVELIEVDLSLCAFLCLFVLVNCEDAIKVGVDAILYVPLHSQDLA